MTPIKLRCREAAVRSAIVALFLSSLPLLAGCIAFTPREPRPPSALRMASSIQVMFDYSGLLVSGMGAAKPESEWLAAKTADDPNYPQTWADLKSNWEQYFMTGLMSASPVPVSRLTEGASPTDGTAVLRVTMSELRLGKYIPFATTDSYAKASMSWWLNEQMVESSDTTAAVRPNLRNPSVFQHIRVIGRDSGASTGRFMHKVRRS